MAEFCLECWNEMSGPNEKNKEYILSKDLDLCEGCGEFKQVIEGEYPYYYLNTVGPIYYQFEFWRDVFKILLSLPYLIYRRKRRKKYKKISVETIKQSKFNTPVVENKDVHGYNDFI